VQVKDSYLVHLVRESTAEALIVFTVHPHPRHSSQFKNNHFTEMCNGSEVGSYLRLIDSCTTQLKAQGPKTCNESKEEEEHLVRESTAEALIVFTVYPHPTPQHLDPEP